MKSIKKINSKKLIKRKCKINFKYKKNILKLMKLI